MNIYTYIHKYKLMRSPVYHCACSHMQIYNICIFIWYIYTFTWYIYNNIYIHTRMRSPVYHCAYARKRIPAWWQASLSRSNTQIYNIYIFTQCTYICIYIHTYIHTHLHHLCTNVPIRGQAYPQTSEHLSLAHTCKYIIYTYLHNVHIYVYIYIYIYIYTYIRIYMDHLCTNVPTHCQVYPQTSEHLSLAHACNYSKYTYLHNVYINIHVNIYIYIHTYIYTYIHKYLHIQMTCAVMHWYVAKNTRKRARIFLCRSQSKHITCVYIHIICIYIHIICIYTHTHT